MKIHIPILSDIWNRRPGVKADWNTPFDTLREKWNEVPTTKLGRQKTAHLLQLSDDDLKSEWLNSRDSITTGEQYQHRGWYHELYRDFMRDKKVMDVGSGFAVDSITFAQVGADVTFVDLAESNLAVLRRLCGIFGLQNVDFVHLESLESLSVLANDFDVIMAMGSLHHAPQSVIKPEVDLLLDHLKVGGRWLQLAYPKTRWKREGSPDFSRWGEITDGEGTPWGEWYDVEKLLDLLAPATFEVVLERDFHNSDFNWFDLKYLGKNSG